MRDLSYKTIFGDSFTHEQAFKKQLISLLVDIEMDENNISEKNFNSIDSIQLKVKKLVTDEILKDANDKYQSGMRIKYIAEMVYDKFIKGNDNISESIVIKFNKFR